MRALPSALALFVSLTATLSVAAAQNVCVHSADGAIVCGPVANRGASAPSPFDRPGGARPITLSSTAAVPEPAQRRAAHEARRHVPPPRYRYRLTPPRELERRAPRQIAGEDARRPYVEHDRQPPPGFEREPPARHSAADWRRYESERESASTRARRERATRRYDDRDPPPPSHVRREQPDQFADLERRTREVERELQALRAERNESLRQAERQDVGRRFYREPPARYRERYHEGERI